MKENIKFRKDVLEFWKDVVTLENQITKTNVKHPYLFGKSIVEIAMVIADEQIKSLKNEIKKQPDVFEFCRNEIEKIRLELIPTHKLFKQGYEIVINKDNSSINEYFPDRQFDYKGYHTGELLAGAASVFVMRFLELQTRNVESKEVANPESNTIKLKWTGNKNQLYDIIRQLKKANLISNSYEDLAVFIKSNVSVFTDTELSTITKEIGKNKRPPKVRRVDLDISE